MTITESIEMIIDICNQKFTSREDKHKEIFKIIDYERKRHEIKILKIQGSVK
jgi:hypothetical protein